MGERARKGELRGSAAMGWALVPRKSATARRAAEMARHRPRRPARVRGKRGTNASGRAARRSSDDMGSMSYHVGYGRGQVGGGAGPHAGACQRTARAACYRPLAVPPLLVILDLDETLVHAPDPPFSGTPDFHAAGHPVLERPHVRPFVEGLLACYRVAVWTASGSLYAEPIVRRLFGDPGRLAFVWSAERCTLHFYHETRRRSTLKLLTKVRKQGYDLDRVLFVDDSPEKHVRNYGNLIRVHPFEGDPEDDELLALLPYIHRLAGEPSMRRVEKRGWRGR